MANNGKTIEWKMSDPAFVAALPKSRAAAKATGSTTYYTGACRRGHNSYRSTVNGSCCACRSLLSAKMVGLAKLDPVKFAAARKIVNERWNASNKGKNAKQRWQIRDPKWAWVVSAVGGARGRAKRKGLLIDIDNVYVHSITPTHCPVLGFEFVFVGNKTILPASPSLDRIIPELGYVKGNVAVISQRANAIKSDATAAEVEKVLVWMRSIE